MSKENVMSQANISFVQSLYAAFGRGEIATIIGALAPDVVWTVNGDGKVYPLMGTWKGPKAVEDFFRGVGEYEEFSDFSPREFHSTEDRVFVLGHYAGKIKTTGGAFKSDWIHVFTVRGGKVVSFREFNDSHAFISAYRK